MSAGDVVRSPEGEEITLVDIGHRVLLETTDVRVWEVSLAPGETHQWHLHHNPYVVLNLEASPCRMDWLDGSPPRYLAEYVGGAVYRPMSPVHRLTNIGDRRYVNRLIEFKALGEDLPAPLDVGEGAHSTEGVVPDDNGLVPAGHCILLHPHTNIWVVDVAAGGTRTVELPEHSYVVSRIVGPDVMDDAAGAVSTHIGGPLELVADAQRESRWFVVQLSYRSNRVRDLVVGGVS